jgi:hypothetical protein
LLRLAATIVPGLFLCLLGFRSWLNHTGRAMRELRCDQSQAVKLIGSCLWALSKPPANGCAVRAGFQEAQLATNPEK